MTIIGEIELKAVEVFWASELTWYERNGECTPSNFEYILDLVLKEKINDYATALTVISELIQERVFVPKDSEVDFREYSGMSDPWIALVQDIVYWILIEELREDPRFQQELRRRRALAEATNN